MQRPRTRDARVAEQHARIALLGLAALTSSSCIVDDDQRCGANQRPSDVPHVSGCECVPNSVLNENGIGCTLCGANEQISADGSACVCRAGFARETAGGACVASQLGASCGAAAPCSGEFAYCAAAGYCTKSGCTSSEMCPGSYTCDTAASPSFCRKPATGIGTMCTSAGTECASFDANYCAVQPGATSGNCSVSGCKTVRARCDTGFVCCDYTAFGLTDLCVSTAQVTNGLCLGTNQPPVTP